MAPNLAKSSNRHKGRHRSSNATSGDHTRKLASRAALSVRNNAARERVLKALWAMRRGDTLSRAARDNGVTIRTIKRYAGSALLQDHPGGRIRATKTDRLVRYMQIAGPEGPREITVRGSKAASQFAHYQADINRLLRGDRHAMAKWHGKKIEGIELITDTKTLVGQARKEILPYGPYRTLSGGAA